MNFNKEIKLKSGHIVGSENKPFLVAEIGLNHNNDSEIGKRTIEAAAKSGANAVKFQSYVTEEFIDSDNKEAKFLFDIFKKYELSEKKHIEFQKAALDEGLVFFSTPLCNSSVDLLSDLNVPILKVASGDIVNYPLLKRCASKGIPIFLSSGAADLFETVRAVEYLDSVQAKNLCLLHCISMYPTPSESVNIGTLDLFKDMFDFPIGFSDHSPGFLASAIAITHGASVIEKHFTLDKNLPGPDHSISLNPDEFKLLSINCNDAFSMKGKKEKIVHQKEIDGRFYGRRSMYFRASGPIALRPAIHIKDSNIPDAWIH